jgi:multiple sugar transport system permease protein
MRARNAIFFWILTSRMIPPMALAVPFFMFFSKLHLLDTHLALIIVYLSFNLALVIWIMRIFFDDVPLEIEEAARIDGCSTFECFWRISLPLVTPGLAATIILCWIMCWNEFLYALILTRKAAKTAPVAVTIFLRFIDVHWGTIAAGSTFIMIPILIFAFVVHKYLISGLVKGALKE